MSRIPRCYYHSNFFHVIVQGIRKEYIFNTEKFINKYKETILKYQSKYNILIIAYCIMNNHAHLLLYCEKIEDMSAFMKSVNTKYALYYNKVLDRVGYVFRGRFLSEPINTTRYLLNCIAYIHNNPVKAKMVKSPDRYIHSSYMDYINKSGIATDKVIRLVFGDSKDYLEDFLVMHKCNVEFRDIIIDNVDCELIIEEFFKNKNKNKSEIYNDTQLLCELVENLKDINGVSIRKICRILELDRNKLRRRLNEQNLIK